MNESFTYNFFSKIIIVLFILALIPFLILCLYSEPSGDDYVYALKLAKGSFMDVQIHEYLHWGSRYTATAVLIANPIHFGWFGGYNVICMLMIVFLIIASFYLFFYMTCNYKLSILLTAFFCFTYLFMLPNVCSAFYWLPGSATYHLANILSLFFIAFLFKVDRSGSLLFHKIFLFILIFLIIGCNEVSMVYLDILVFILFIYSYYTQKKINLLYLGLFLWAGALTLFILTAPGNSARSGSFSGYLLLSSISMSLRKSAVMFIRYGIISFFINFLVFYNVRDQLKKLNFKFLQLPFYFYLILFFVLLFLGSFPSLFTLGIYPPLRTVNVIFFMMLLFVMIFNYKLVTGPLLSQIKLSPLVSVVILVIVVLGYSFSIRNKNVLELTNNVYTAYNDLLNGSASQYKKEIGSRYLQIQQSKEDTVYVEPLRVKPRSIFDSDLGRDPNHFYNQGIAEFFKKKVIISK